MNAFAFTATSLVTLKEIVPKFLIVQNVEQEDTHRTDAPTNHRGPDTRAKLENPEINRKGMKISHSFQAVTISVFSVQEIIRPQIVHDNDKLQPLTVLLVVQVPLHQNAPNTSHSHLFILIHNHQPTHSQSTLHVQTPTLNINAPPFPSNLHQAPPPPLAQNKKALIITLINNKCTHHQHSLLMHSFHNLLTLMFHHHIFHNIPTNSPSAHSTDSSILLALQKQWERQERLDMECVTKWRNRRRKEKE